MYSADLSSTCPYNRKGCPYDEVDVVRHQRTKVVPREPHILCRSSSFPETGDEERFFMNSPRSIYTRSAAFSHERIETRSASFAEGSYGGLQRTKEEHDLWHTVQNAMQRSPCKV